MERVGVLGLGRMGLPIARRLRDAGHTVTAFDPASEQSGSALSGLKWADCEQEVACRSEILMTVLPGPVELREAMLGQGGALDGLAAGSSWLDLTSNDPRVATEVATAAEARRVLCVGAPMGGGPSDAIDGSLRFWVGGTDAALARVTPLLTTLGDAADLLRTGLDVGSAFTMKLLANTLWFGQVIAVTEVMLLGQALGLDIPTLRDTLAAGPGGSTFITKHLDALLDGDYLASFGLPRVVEELNTVRDLAAAAGTPRELTSLVGRIHAEALQHYGPVDGELLAAKLLEERAGQVLRRPRA